MIDESSATDLDRPRTTPEIVTTAVSLYARHPLMIVVLSLAVVAPYQLIVLAVTGSSPAAQQHVKASTVLILLLVDFALIGPLVSALLVQVLVPVAGGEAPRLAVVVRRGVIALPVVAAAEIVAGIGIGIGLLAFVIPGVILAIRWAVVAQVAAVERPDWIGALRRGAQLTAGHYLHVLGVLVISTVVSLALSTAADAITGTSVHAPQIALEIAVATLARSFTSLLTAVLYFDLRARARG